MLSRLRRSVLVPLSEIVEFPGTRLKSQAPANPDDAVNGGEWR